MKEILEDTKKQFKKLSQFFHLKYSKWSEYFNKKSNVEKVGLSGFLSAIIFVFIYFTVIRCSSEDSVGYWNFIILIVSSPVAFVIWHFRDENSRQQIENQRKDINLKEFQKLSEWVSGAHLPEIKIVEKNITKSSFTTDNESAASPEKKITEQTEECSKEYGQKPDTAHSDTFGKWDGAVALQISAIYNLLPFFRGDYGESFRLPAFNLLKSAWQAMQQGELNKLNNLKLREQENTISISIIQKKDIPIKKTKKEIISNPRKKAHIPMDITIKKGRDISINQEKDIPIREIKKDIISNLRKKAHSPMGIALTHVLLSQNRENTQLNLQDFPEMILNLCLAGMDFSIKHNKIISPSIIESTGIYLSEIKLSRINLSRINLSGVDLSGVNLSGAILFKTILSGANLSNADLSGTILSNAILSSANLSDSDLSGTILFNAILSYANLSGANLSGANLSGANLSGANLSTANFSNNTNLKNADLRHCYFQPRLLKNKNKITGAKITIFDFYTQIYSYWKHQNDPEWENLTEPEQKEAMQKFCNETGMIIFDNKENVIAKRQS